MPDLEADVRHALAVGHPLPLLELASAMLNAIDPRNLDPMSRSAQPELPPLPELLGAFVESGPSTAALAWAIGQLSDDRLLQARVDRDLGSGVSQLPEWLRRLDEITAVAAEQTVDILRDSFNVVVHLAGFGADITSVSLVDFNLGTVVKDSFVVPQSVEQFTAFWTSSPDAALVPVEPLSLADARARIEGAIEVGAMTWPPLESDTWPATRPLLEWLLRRLPTGGTGFVRPRWTDRKRAGLIKRFLSSRHAPTPAMPDDGAIVEDLLWYRTDYGYGDPLRWSPTAVEILLLDWYPRKVLADQVYLGRMPVVLRAFISFAHADVGLTDDVTASPLAAVAALEADYRDLVGDGQSSPPAALLAGLGLAGFEGLAPFGTLDGLDLGAHLLGDQVGGPDLLARLDDDPLPDEPFDLTDLAEGLREPVSVVLELVDACCERYFDVEVRTAVRRLLHDVAVARPRVFSGKGSPTTAAAALCWLVARANDEVRYPEIVPTAELADHFGLTSMPFSRAATMRRAIGAEDLLTPGSLGSVRYLTSAQRRYLIALRDRSAAEG